jgi:glucokinase
VIVGVDLGGTNVRAAVVAADGGLAGPAATHSSQGAAGAAATAGAVVRAVRDAITGAGRSPDAIRAVGVAVPGHVDGAAGVVRWAPNLGETRSGVFEPWRDVPLAALVGEGLGRPVVLGNDANLAALGEYRFGSGRGATGGLVLLTLGTGIGGGVVLTARQVQGGAPWPGGVLLVGAGGGAAELGHTVVLAGGPRCGCGAAGCVEALANRDAIVARARARVRHAPGSRLEALAGGDLARITPQLVSEAAAAGDEVALGVWAETGRYVGIAVANLVNTFDPEVVAIGGQIAKAGEPLLAAVRRAARDHAIPTLFAGCRIAVAQRIDDAGILGGAALAAQLVPPS